MHRDSLSFRVTRLEASVPEGVPITWEGREIPSGPLAIELEADRESQGRLDYAGGRAAAQFHVTLRFPELARALEGLGVDPAITEPVRAVLHSEGDILPDHGFELAGRCELAPHGLFAPGGTTASVLPGQ
jgi:hypothetical protein